MCLRFVRFVCFIDCVGFLLVMLWCLLFVLCVWLCLFCLERLVGVGGYYTDLLFGGFGFLLVLVIYVAV